MASNSIILSEREEYILLVLMKGERYGNQIMEAIEEVSNDVIPIGCRTYPLLRRLKKGGYVDSRLEEAGLEIRRGNRRTYYWITDKGINALKCRQEFRQALLNWKPSPS
ncbi:MAG: hypothetical protein F6J86_04780 [Symploca sp. SIO1B1]|nr:hypothetical protein [Symploca sp. SIO1B1]